MVLTKVRALRFVQKDLTFYTFVVNSSELRSVVYLLPKSRDRPKDINRALDLNRVEEIGKYIKDDPRGVFPNNFILNLRADVSFQPDPADPAHGVLIFPDLEPGEKVGYLLDGQHRLFGFEKSGGIEFDLPVTAIIDGSEEVAYKIFADINSLQVKVTKVLLDLLRFEIQGYEADKQTAISIVHSLDKDNDSVLKNRIRIYPQDKDRWVIEPSLSKWILAITGTGGPLNGASELQQRNILKSYYRAFSEEYKNEWDDRKNYVLTKAQGIELITALFPSVHQRCILKGKKGLSVEAFREQIKELRGKQITLPDGKNTMAITWASKEFSQLTSGKAMKWLKKELLNALPAYPGTTA